MKKQLTFNEFVDISVKRCEEVFHKVNDWSPTDWGCALAGEVGEACNMLKKRRRGNKITDKKLAKELGDIAAYLALLSARLGINLEKAVIHKFNEVSRKKKSSYLL